MRRLGFWLALALGLTLILTAALVLLDLFDARNLIPLSDHYDWLAFVGAVLGGVIGGLITFGGVYLTLRQQRESETARDVADAHRDQQRKEAEDLRNRLSSGVLGESDQILLVLEVADLRLHLPERRSSLRSWPMSARTLGSKGIFRVS